MIKYQEKEWLNNQAWHPFSSLKPSEIYKGVRSKFININLNQSYSLFCSLFGQIIGDMDSKVASGQEQ